MSITSDAVRAVYAAAEEPLPNDVAHLAKRALLDSIACMYGGLGSATGNAVMVALPNIDSGGTGATLLGTSRQSGLCGAILYNGGLLRFLDMNDSQRSEVRVGYGHGHNSEVIPAIFAASELNAKSGDDMLRMISVGYDLGTGWTDASLGRSLEQRGWMGDTRAAFAVPPVLCCLMGLSEACATNALGLAISRSALLQVLDVGSEVNTLAKNLRYPLTSYVAAVSVFLASAGITGPENVMEGQGGFIPVVLGGEFEAELVSSKWRRHRIREVQNKPYPACTATHGHIAATLNLVKGNDIKPEAVEKVHIVCSPRCLEHCAGPGRRRVPENKETADHNSFFLTAVAIVDRQVGLGQFSDAKYSDPGIVRLMEKIEMEASEAFSDTFYGAEVEITTSSGSVYHDRVEFPPGHPSNPMSDTDIEQKFMMLSEPWVDERVAREISEAVWELDSGVSLERLASLLASPVRGSV